MPLHSYCCRAPAAARAASYAAHVRACTSWRPLHVWSLSWSERTERCFTMSWRRSKLQPTVCHPQSARSSCFLPVSVSYLEVSASCRAWAAAREEKWRPPELQACSQSEEGANLE